MLAFSTLATTTYRKIVVPHKFSNNIDCVLQFFQVETSFALAGVPYPWGLWGASDSQCTGQDLHRQQQHPWAFPQGEPILWQCCGGTLLREERPPPRLCRLWERTVWPRAHQSVCLTSRDLWVDNYLQNTNALKSDRFAMRTHYLRVRLATWCGGKTQNFGLMF